MTPFDIMAPSLAKSALVVRPPGPRELYKYSRLSKWIPESLAGVLHEEISTPFAAQWPEEIRSVLGSFDHVHDPLLQIFLRNLRTKLLQEVKGHSLFSNTALSLCPGGIVSGFQIRPEVSDSFFNLKLDLREIEAPAQPSITGFLVWLGEGLSADVCLEIISDPRNAHSVLILVVAEKDSRTDLNLIISGSGQIRCNTFVSLAGPAARAHLRSAILSSPSSHHDLYYWVQHRAPDTESNQTVRMLGASDSTSVFSGHIVVENSAPRTTAYQSAKALLLQEDALAYMRPFLEIYHDDVRCSHGCTTGFLDPEQLFYLRSRGISESRARQELTEAFVREVFSSVGPVIEREYLNSALKNILNTCT